MPAEHGYWKMLLLRKGCLRKLFARDEYIQTRPVPFRHSFSYCNESFKRIYKGLRHQKNRGDFKAIAEVVKKYKPRKLEVEV